MVLNGLGFANHTLYLMPRFFQDKPLERLFSAGFKAEHLNDDVMGRTLDKLYSYSLNKIYSILAARAVHRLKLSGSFAHLDSTGFHLDGKYNQESSSEGLIKITKGYSRDHRPDLNQVVLQLICVGLAGIPWLMEPLNGNNSDKDSFRQTIAHHIGQLNNDFKLEYIVADSALYVSETLAEMNDFFWISRVPETLTNAVELIKNIAPDLMANPSVMAWRTRGEQLCRR
jgi:transposase